MSKQPTGKIPTEIRPEKGDLTVLDREDEGKEARYRPTAIEPRNWRGEGVVGDNHTD